MFLSDKVEILTIVDQVDHEYTTVFYFCICCRMIIDILPDEKTL